jgi:hypothetical protein
MLRGCITMSQSPTRKFLKYVYGRFACVHREQLLKRTLYREIQIHPGLIMRVINLFSSMWHDAPTAAATRNLRTPNRAALQCLE